MSVKPRMVPIRNIEMDYWNFSIDEQYETRQNSLKTEMVDEINDIADDNYETFKKKLKIDDLMSDIKKMYEDYHLFKNQKELIEQEKKNALDKSINALEDQLVKYNKVRKWKTDLDRSLLQEPNASPPALVESTLNFISSPLPTADTVTSVKRMPCSVVPSPTYLAQTFAVFIIS